MDQPYSWIVAASLTMSLLVGIAVSQSPTTKTDEKKESEMQLGVFSVSLTVKDIKVSKSFYEKLDFKQVAGDIKQNWVILQNGTTTIGLFQGMFEKNIMTFNPGWDKDQNTLKEFEDVRDLQAELIKRGITPATRADTTGDGPASFVITDPDGNPILVDQHVPKP